MTRSPRVILWHFADLPSTERCVVLEGEDGSTLTGTVLTLLHGEPVEIRYVIRTDAGWRTRHCRVEIASTGPARTIVLDVDAAGNWIENGLAAPRLSGAIDVDLGFTPATNTLPIRRLNLPVGEEARITAAWLRFPELDVVSSDQVYRRLDERTYRYESGTGDFRADLEVDAAGVVTRYGSFWRELRENG